MTATPTVVPKDEKRSVIRVFTLKIHVVKFVKKCA